MTPWHERLAVLDAGEPWFAPWRDVGTPVARRLARGAPLHEALNVHASGVGLPSMMTCECFCHLLTSPA